MIRKVLFLIPFCALSSLAQAQDYDPFHEYDFRSRDLVAVLDRPFSMDVPEPQIGREDPAGSWPAWTPTREERRPERRPVSVQKRNRESQVRLAMASPEFFSIEDTFVSNPRVDEWFMGSRRLTPLLAEVSIADQEMTLTDRGRIIARWPVSTGKDGYASSRGTFRVTFLSRNHVSSLYNAPMPCAVFYNGGEAIHGTTATGKLGSRASAGCVRVRTENACFLHDEVQRRGKDSLTVVVR